MGDVEVTQDELDILKVEVLRDKMFDISEQLGDPGRYFASFRAKELLSQSDCEEIKMEKNSMERVRVLIEKVKDKRGHHNEHPYDVFVSALKKLRVHVHIVKILNTDLSSKRAALVNKKKVGLAISDITDTGFPSNGAISNSSSLSQTSDSGTMGVVSKGPTSSSSTGYSPVSSSSSHGATPPILSSPHTDTDLSFVSQPSIIHRSPINEHLPTLPHGYDDFGKKIKTSHPAQTTPGLTDDDGMPSLPPGYGSDGRKIDDISQYISPKEPIHPNHGLMPPGTPPSSDLPRRVQSSSGLDSAMIVNDLRVTINKLQCELEDARMTIDKYSCAMAELHKENKLLADIKNRLESQLAILSGSPTINNTNGMAGSTTPHNLYGNWSASMGSGGIMHPRKRNTEPYFGDAHVYMPHRQSEPNMLSVPTRPTRLGLNKKIVVATSPNSHPGTYSSDHSPMYDTERDGGFMYLSRNPVHYDGGRGRMSRTRVPNSSTDDLTSGGEDKSSLHSIGSENSGNVLLTTQGTNETVV